MKIKQKIFLPVFLIALFGIACVNAAPKLKMDLRPDGLYLDNLNVAVMKKIFQDYGYVNVINKEKTIPPLMLEHLPADFDKIKLKDERNQLFIMVLAPLTLKINEELALERQDLILIKEVFDKGKELDSKQKEKVENLAKKYDVFTRMKGRDRFDILLNALAEKIDQIPPALLIATAAAESNWGTAVEVKKGNSLYKLKDWYTDKGIKPAGEDDDSYRIRVYPNLYESIRDYALKLNSDINFQHFRISRRQLRAHNQILKGRTTVYNMVTGSPLENYAGLLTYILTFYDLINIDESHLGNIKVLEKK